MPRLTIRAMLAATALSALAPYSVRTAVAQTAAQDKLARTDADTDRPLKWLIGAQNDNGGWGDGVKTAPDVATTALSGIALIRMGHTAKEGKYSASTRKAVDFVVEAIEKSPQNEVDINAAGTLPQRKLGRHIDTFLGAQFLAEALPGYSEGPARVRVRNALDKVVDKVQRAQRPDGSYSADGWAPVLSSAFANDGLYAARAAGARVDKEKIAKGDQYMMNNYDAANGRFRTESSAGVQLYTVAGTFETAQRTGQLGGAAGQAAMHLLTDENFLRGVGTYGGEEHVSYMMTSEALAKIGGKDWERWDHGIRLRLAHIQRDDGTWRGDHCITSTSFCTAASLVTLAIHAQKKQS